MEGLTLFLERVVPALVRGTGVTIQLSFMALLVGLLVGLPVGLMRTYGDRLLRWVTGGYVSLFRGVPLLIQLFMVYYGLPGMGRFLAGLGLPDISIVLSRTEAAVVTLGLNSAAYQAEYFRGALQSVGSGQMLAARAIGMSRWKAIRYIILPQAVRIALPAWSNEIIAMIKYTSVVFLIAVPELMGQAKILSGRYFDPIPIYLTVALFYLVLVGIASLGLRFVEKRMEYPGVRDDEEAPLKTTQLPSLRSFLQH